MARTRIAVLIDDLEARLDTTVRRRSGYATIADIRDIAAILRQMDQEIERAILAAPASGGGDNG